MLQIIKASAGSGKTFKITQEFLQLVFKNPENYRHILLTTFTNKATAEMKSRIIKSLFEISNGNKNDYSEGLGKNLGFSEEEIQTKAKEILAKIISDYERFSVTTIDSLFQRILRDFAKEIKLPGAYEIEMDSAKVMDESVDLLIDSITEDSSLLNWMIEFSEEKISEGKDYKIQNQIKRIASKLLKEDFQRIESNLAQFTEDKELMQKMQKSVVAQHNASKQKALEIAQRISQLLKDNNLIFKDLKSNFLGRFEKIIECEIIGLTDTALNNIDNPDNWYTRTSTKVIEILGVYPKINELLKDYAQNVYPNYITLKLIRENIYVFGIISDIIHHLAEYRKTNNIILIGDAQNLLREVIGDNETPFVYEKIGNVFKNFMLDEFQDTSTMQWENFKPLINNSISEGNESFVVGDVKQSIYRFRGGDWKLLLYKIQKEIALHNEKSLSGNWRSSENVVGFNNHFFSTLPEIMKNFDLNLPTNNEYATVFEDVFKDVAQDIPKNRVGGKVRIERVVEKENVLYKTISLDKMFVQIAELLDLGYSQKDICILIRNNRQSTEIIEHSKHFIKYNEAHKNKEFKFISQESLFINNNFAVILMVNSIRFLSEKGDDLLYAAIIEAWNEYKGEKFEAGINTNWYSSLPKVLVENASFLKKLDIVQLVESLCSLYQFDLYPQHSGYIQTFLDSVHKYTQKYGDNFYKFNEWWEENNFKFSIQAPESIDAIKIMTMHKSKGLEFEFVMVPFYHFQNYTNPDADFIWVKPEQLSEFGIEYYPIKLSSALGETAFSDIYFEERVKSMLDDINLMYVTFTRAKKGLFIWYQNYPSNGASFAEAKILDVFVRNTSGYYLPEYFSSEGKVTDVTRNELLNSNEEDNENVFSWGNIINISKSKEVKDSVSSSMELIEMENLGFATNPLNIKNNVIGLRKSKELLKGSELHEFLAMIKVKEDLDRAIHYFQKHFPIPEEELKIWETKLQSIFEMDIAKHWFDGTYNVLNERALSTESSEDILIPDKLLFKEDKAIIVDYKSGKEYQNQYEKQLLNYKKAVVELGFKNVETYLLYWDELRIEKLEI